jgi:GTP-binding protein
VSFRREKYVPKGGPDGGDGGRGGDVVFFVRENVKTLSHLKMQQRFFAQNGRPGAGRQKGGPRGDDVVIEVPPGTAVFDAESDEQLLDLTEIGERAVLYQGGRGGKGNTHFKSSRHQTPRFAQPGEDGVEKNLRVELQIIADLGFVGLPNAGKSTLLKVLTAANPKIGNYPFTTVIPNLGVMHHYEHDIVLADIPGLIAGASNGAGLGIQFLKHIARTRGLVYVLDVADEDLDASWDTLSGELAAYSRELVRKQHIVLLTKMDLVDSGDVPRAAVDDFIRDHPVVTVDHDDPDAVPPPGSLLGVIPVSAMTGTGLAEARDVMANLANAPVGDHVI